MSLATDSRAYPRRVEPGVAEHERAVDHRQHALDALADDAAAHVVLAHALLAVEARVEELTCYVARGG